MSLLCIGLNHQSAPLENLERVSLSEPQMRDFLCELRSERCIREIAGLSTCNRTEFYVVAEEVSEGRRVLVERLAGRHNGAPAFEPGEHAYTHRNERAARHLFRVAAGVDSLIVGEAEILGQLRRAYELALGVGTAGGMLNSLLVRAISFGRKVRTRTNIGKGNVSVASISVKVALETFPDLGSRCLLVIGAGETARLAAQHFHTHGVARMMVVNRTRDNAECLLEQTGAEFVPIEAMQSAIEAADVIVSAVNAPHHIITRGGLEGLLASRGGAPLALIDLSMPRNIDPLVADLAGVRLTTIDDLQGIAAENRQQRLQEIAQVESMVEEETESFIRWTQTADSGRLVAALRRRVERQRQAHFERYGRSLSDEQKAAMERFTDSLLRSVLHDLTMNLRGIDPDSEEGRQRIRLACELFNISSDEIKE